MLKRTLYKVSGQLCLHAVRFNLTYLWPRLKYTRCILNIIYSYPHVRESVFSLKDSRIYIAPLQGNYSAVFCIEVGIQGIYCWFVFVF